MLKSVRTDGRPSDIKEIRKIYDSSFPYAERVPFERLIRSIKEDRIMYAYYDDGKLIGISYLFLLDDIAYIGYFCVREDLRNKGYGTQILEMIKEDFSGYRIAIDIEEVKENSDNYEERKRRKDFYLHKGFREAGIFYNFYDVDYEILVYGGAVDRQQWHDVIRRHWGKNSKLAKYRQ